MNSHYTNVPKSQEVYVYPTVDPPTINLSKLLQDPALSNPEVRKLHSVCHSIGYFQLINHGFEESFLKKLDGDMKSFFALPAEEKRKFEKKAGDQEGYGNVGKTDRFFAVVNPKSRVKPHLFPRLPTSLRETIEFYREKLEGVVSDLLEIFSTCLEIKFEDDTGINIFREGYQAIRIAIYPRCSQPDDLVEGLTPHSDTTALTVLREADGVNGLQVEEDNTWKLVRIKPEALLFNIGDLVEIFSRGRYKSVVHRVVVNSNQERFSLALSFNPHLDAVIKPMGKGTDDENNGTFVPIKMADYVNGFSQTNLKGNRRWKN